ncbi:MAG: TonB family protein [Kiritimatiellia bacterium]
MWRWLLATVREGVLWAATLALHLLVLFLLMTFLVRRQTAPRAPECVFSDLTMELSEVEADSAASASQQSTAATQASTIPDADPFLSDPLEGLDVPEPPAAPMPVLPRSATMPAPDPQPSAELSPDRVLPEISLPPAIAVSGAGGKGAGGATARLESPRLLTDLSRLRKRYPPEARRNHWEGAITLELSIAADGSLSAVRVAVSCGHRILDEAACKMIRSARFTGGPGILLQTIEYRLK